VDVKESKERKVDVEDALLVLAIACVVGGTAMWSRPAALDHLWCDLLRNLHGSRPKKAGRRETVGRPAP
jgi:hypothetical protein